MQNHGRFYYHLSIDFLIVAIISMFAFQSNAEIQGEFVAGEYVVQLKDSVGAMSIGQMKDQAIFGFSTKVKGFASEKGRSVVVQKSIIERPEAVIEQLSKNPMVKIVEPNYIYHASNLPNDSRLEDLWGLKNKNKNNGGVDIDAEAAWAVETGSKDIVVAVIDTGVNYNHADLKNNMWVNSAEANGQRGVDDDGNGFVDDIYGYDFANNDGNPMDDNDHGTHVAGTIGAEGNNGIGIVGVNWKVSIMALKFLTGSGGGTLEGALKSIDYATQMGVDIMSNSWGGGGASETLKAAIERAEAKGILFVAAAGNERNNNDAAPTYPANYDVSNVVSVAAVDSRGNLASFSNYGKNTVHIAAPGVDTLSTGKNGGYISLSGTSMATPHVSGVAALVLANEPDLTMAQLKERILATSAPKAALRNRVAHGLLNAYNAVTNTLPPPDPNDPTQWPSMAEEVSTPHPYTNDFDESYTVTVPGAEKVAVRFERLETERGFDKVLFYDGSGQEIGEMTGNQSGNFSPVANGDTIVIRMKSDYSVTGYGFDIDKVHYKGTASGAWRSKADPVSTAHPYSNRFDREVTFEEPGATEIKVKFGRFETEKRYDFVYFYDENGKEIGKWDGDHSGEFSPKAQGEKLVVRLRTDWSITKYGFDVETVHFKY